MMATKAEIMTLRDELRSADAFILDKIREGEQVMRELETGIPIPMGDFIFVRLNGKWRFYHPESERPVTDMPRNERAAFAAMWLKLDVLLFAAKLALENALKERQKLI